MGIGRHAVRALADAQQRGVDFGRTLMLGRQALDDPAPRIASLLRAAGCTRPPPLPLDDPAWRFAEPFFAWLGARQVDALDASDFEGARLVHDLNRPVPAHLHGRYDVVFDGGTLEHVFEYPTALRSAMRMVRVGGRLILHAPGDQWLGHGFYQLSPELFFRALSPENGFAIEELRLVEAVPDGRAYRMRDPAQVRARAQTRSEHPVLLFVEARKEREVAELFATPPQQSDYAAEWAERPAAPPKRSKRARRQARTRRLLAGCPPLRVWYDRRCERARAARAGFAAQSAFYERLY
jgi:hypothetical protein